MFSLLICINTLIKKVYLFSSSHTNTYCELNSEMKAFVKQLTKCKFNVNGVTIAIIAWYKNVLTLGSIVIFINSGLTEFPEVHLLALSHNLFVIEGVGLFWMRIYCKRKVFARGSF